MGCAASNSTQLVSELQFDNPYVIQVSKTWDNVQKTVDKRTSKKTMDKYLVIRRKGWKTIRIFVSSTFKDFHQEREVLVKKVFPDLRIWCESKRLYLIECDLRWGVPKDFTTEATLRACLGEIDRCYQDNVMPFFLNMTSERCGWVPGLEEIPSGVLDEYKWVDGLSVTEMEILHGAYRNDNPNALFMLRDSSYLDSVPESEKKGFIEETELANAKLQVLKKKITEKFDNNKRVATYNVEYCGFNSDTNTVKLGGLEGKFSETVYEFFKKRIEVQYPLLNADEMDEFEVKNEQHESFMNHRSNNIIGRDDVITQMTEYMSGGGDDVPFMLIGGAGSGKSSVIAKIAEIATTRAIEGKLTIGGSKQKPDVFYHFVGAVPGSTEVLHILHRLLLKMKIVKKDDLPADIESAAQRVSSALANTKSTPIVVIVDALNQLDDDLVAEMVTWVPRKLSPFVRCIFSMIPDTKQHVNLATRDPLPIISKVVPLTVEDRKAIVNDLLGRYNKRLDAEQMEAVLLKQSSENPLWLSIACEELRVFGMFRMISEKIKQLPDGLLELEMEIMTRFEEESGGELLTATLCLLEVSARGLLETELLRILADEDNLMPGSNRSDHKGIENQDSKTFTASLPAYKWAAVYRALRPFLRPFGDSGEGRLDFYHRSLSKAVRKKYFKTADGQEKKDIYVWWHSKLADYFYNNCNNIARQTEELPNHLIAIKDETRLRSYLCRWEVFDLLFDDEYSMKLLKYWRLGSSLEKMGEDCMSMLDKVSKKEKVDKEDLCEKSEHICKLMSQGGQYERADELSTQTMELAKELGSAPGRMARIYFLRASSLDEWMKLEEYMYRSQLPRMRSIIENFESAIELLQQETSIKAKNLLGRAYSRLSFYYSGYGLRGGDDWCSTEESRIRSMDRVDFARRIFTDLNDQLHIADCAVSKAVCYGRACPEQIASYKEAEEILLQSVGENNIIMDRLYLNMAIYYEENGDYYTAYDLFYKWYLVCCDIYGRSHPKVKRPINTLREPMYRRIAQERDKQVPTPMDEDPQAEEQPIIFSTTDADTAADGET